MKPNIVLPKRRANKKYAAEKNARRKKSAFKVIIIVHTFRYTVNWRWHNKAEQLYGQWQVRIQRTHAFMRDTFKFS